jgi:hypothetical protein
LPEADLRVEVQQQDDGRWRVEARLNDAEGDDLPTQRWQLAATLGGRRLPVRPGAPGATTWTLADPLTGQELAELHLHVRLRASAPPDAEPTTP